MKYIKAILSALTLLILTSCLSIDTEINLNENGSGTAHFNYSVSTLAADIGKIDIKNEVLPFPILKEDFDNAALRAGGIEILVYTLSDDGSRYYIDSDISFDNLDSLSNFTGIQFQRIDSGNNSLLTVLIYEGSEENTVTDETLSIVNGSFPNDAFSFKITFQGDIVRVDGATFSGSVVSYNISVNDLIQRTDNVQFSVEYR